MDILKDTKPQLLFILLLLLAAVGFSLFQAVSALSGGNTSPEYQRVPPAAFAEVPYLTLFPENVSSNSLERGTRLDDASYVELLDRSQDLTDAIFARTISESDLLDEGMSPRDAASIWLEIEALLPVLSESNLKDLRYNKIKLKAKPLLGDDVSDIIASAESIVDFELSSRSGSIQYDFVSDGVSAWSLSSINID